MVLLLYPFFLCQFLSATGQSYQVEQVLNIQLDLGLKPKVKPVTETDLKEIYTQNLKDVLSLIFFESDSAFEALKVLEEERIEAINSYTQDNPWKGFLKAEIKLQWAFLKLKYGEEWGAFWGLKNASRYVEDNKNDFPDFNLIYRTSGLLQVLFGITPDTYQWVFNLFGMKGNVLTGIKELELVKDNEDIFGLETNIILGMIYSHLLEDFGISSEFIKKHPFSNSPLAHYFPKGLSFKNLINQKQHANYGSQIKSISLLRLI